MNRKVKEITPDISRKVVERLPRYYRYLRKLLSEDVRRISSVGLASRMGVTASQIRQDLNCFGDFGRQGYGYNVAELYDIIGELLGVEEKYRAVIIGAGNLGRFLATSKTFMTRGVYLKAIFDVDENLIGKEFSGIAVQNMSEFENYCSKNQVDIAVLTVPADKAAEVYGRICALDISGVWNFTGVELPHGKNIIVQNVHLGDQLMNLCYHIHENKMKSENTDN